MDLVGNRQTGLGTSCAHHLTCTQLLNTDWLTQVGRSLCLLANCLLELLLCFRLKKKIKLRFKKLQFEHVHGDNDDLWSDEKINKLFGHNDHCYDWRKTGEAC